MKNIDSKALISKSAIIHNFVSIIGECMIGENVVVYPYSLIINSTIESGTVIYSSHIENSFVGSKVKIGPSAHLRAGTKIEDNVRIGNFVEIKNSAIAESTKIAHLAYVGDATVGKNCNIGCGVVFCNYDGSKKHKTTVGDNVFIGSNVNLIAPITIEANCFLAAGSTITKNTPTNTFVIERSEERQRPNKFVKE
jgi:bifunctional UDP-N-acetylglucosamine pyrophosphorylase/glucosamine-1-phosphate N-acetyltransferase